MGRIRILSDQVANQIAAGEVVDRPASVVKELLENALDAGATRIRIEVEAGGRKLIRIADNGHGMGRDDAMLAFERHATSKIRSSDDLLSIATLGFRGEALPSIASISRLKLTTRMAEDPSGTAIEILGGKMVRVEDAGVPPGTTISVRDIFFNTPARRKFLKAETTELSHVTALVTHYALAHPDKHFELHSATHALLVAPPVQKVSERIYQVFGSDTLAQLLPELVGVISVIVGSYVLAALIFAKLALIVPVVVPTVALTLASLAAVIWERAQEKAASLERDLKAAEEKFSLQSALHKSELARQKAVGEAREAVMDRERRQEFARRINHDLRAPVSVLSWTIAKLRGKKLTESERAEKIDRLTSTTDKLFALINELVSSYTADENRPSEPMVHERCDVDVVLTECIKIQQVLAEQRQGSLTLTATVKNCLVEGDKLKLSRVVDNIVRNAFLHNEKGTSVSISLTSDSGKNIIRITDNGQGIEKEHLEKIFTAGYRIGKTEETGAADGQGLGLNIALSLVENMKGSLQVESTVGEGTTFIISLPAAGLNQSETMTDQPQQDKTENERDAEAKIGAVELMETKEVKAKR